MKTKKVGIISTIAALALTLSVTSGFAASAMTNEKSVAETSIFDAAIPANANNQEDEQKPFMHYIFDDETMREVSENEFQSLLKKNSEQRMLCYFVHDGNIYQMSKEQFDEVVEKNNVDEVIQRNELSPIELSVNQQASNYNYVENTFLSSTRATGSWSINNGIGPGVRMNYFMPDGGSFVVNSGETVYFSISPNCACWLTAGVFGSKEFSTPSSYIDKSSYYGITLGSDEPGSYNFYAINDNSFNITVSGSVSIF